MDGYVAIGESFRGKDMPGAMISELCETKLRLRFNCDMRFNF